MYPTQSAVNFLNVPDQHPTRSLPGQERRRLPPANTSSQTCATPPASRPGDQNDNNCLNNVSVQGSAGFVLSEHVVADTSTSTTASAASSSTTARTRPSSATSSPSTPDHPGHHGEQPYGTKPGPCSVRSAASISSRSPHHRPEVSNTTHGVWDPGNRLVGSLRYHCGCPLRQGTPRRGCQESAIPVSRRPRSGAVMAASRRPRPDYLPSDLLDGYELPGSDEAWRQAGVDAGQPRLDRVRERRSCRGSGRRSRTPARRRCRSGSRRPWPACR
jgi:hypothetical protein